MAKLVHGVGINDRTYPAKIGGKHTKEYVLWKAMLGRCYSEKVHVKKPTYIGCTVSDNFKNYTYFFEWCQVQIGFFEIGYQLDKDILSNGKDKIYSENTCVFLPNSINSLLLKSAAIRGNLPIGVSKKGNNYRVRCNVNGSEKYLGTFSTPELAFNAYKTFKEAYIKELAEKYKDTIDSRAYQALLNHEVSIDD